MTKEYYGDAPGMHPNKRQSIYYGGRFWNGFFIQDQETYQTARTFIGLRYLNGQYITKDYTHPAVKYDVQQKLIEHLREMDFQRRFESQLGVQGYPGEVYVDRSWETNFEEFINKFWSDFKKKKPYETYFIMYYQTGIHPKTSGEFSFIYGKFEDIMRMWKQDNGIKEEK